MPLPDGRAPAPARPEPEPAPEQFRARLLEGLQAAIDECGYRDTTVTDIVRHARASRRTFYQVFATKDDCFVALMAACNQALVLRIEEAVDPRAPWRRQARQAVEAYLEQVAGRPAVFRSWIRELPSLGPVAEQVQRDGMDAMAGLVRRLTGGPAFRRSGLPPASRELALIMLGGLRELTATLLEEGRDVRAAADVAVAATVALLGTSRRPPVISSAVRSRWRGGRRRSGARTDP